jgi:hypothetical protein
MTVILSRFEGWKGKERGNRGRTAWLAIPARLRFLLGRYWSHDTRSHDRLPPSETGLVRTLRVQRVFGMPPPAPPNRISVFAVRIFNACNASSAEEFLNQSTCGSSTGDASASTCVVATSLFGNLLNCSGRRRRTLWRGWKASTLLPIAV